MGITCYRLYEQDIPEVPLVVDRYEDYLHIAEFSRPTDHTPAEHADWLDLMQRTAAEVMEVPLDHVFLKKRERQRGTAQYERLGTEQHLLVAHEGGLQFEVNLSDYLDTGLFLDHRITRGMVRDLAAGKRFLNLFAYTGSFTVYAAAGGAASTVTVDLSNTYLDWAQRNMARNGFQGPDHEFVRDDAMHFLQGRGRRAAFDLAVVDAADLLQQQEPGRLLGHPAEPRRVAQPARGTDGARGDHLLLDELPPLQAGRGGDPRRDDPRDQPPDRAGRFPQPADPPLLADGASVG